MADKKPENFDEEIKKILERDPVDEVEKGINEIHDPLIDGPDPALEDCAENGLDEDDGFGARRMGQDYSPEDMLAHAFRVNALKQAAMELTGDTSFTNTVERYLRIAKEVGFTVVLELPFSVNDKHDKITRNEKFFVLWRKDGILLTFDTYGEDHVNGGNFYYNWKANEFGSRHDATSSGGYVLPPGKKWDDVDGQNLTWAGHHDCREGLKFHIRQLEHYGKFLPKWEGRPHLWLLHHGDTDGKQWFELKSDEINEERIKMLPKEVQEAITPKL